MSRSKSRSKSKNDKVSDKVSDKGLVRTGGGNQNDKGMIDKVTDKVGDKVVARKISDVGGARLAQGLMVTRKKRASPMNASGNEVLVVSDRNCQGVMVLTALRDSIR